MEWILIALAASLAALAVAHRSDHREIGSRLAAIAGKVDEMDGKIDEMLEKVDKMLDKTTPMQ